MNSGKMVELHYVGESSFSVGILEFFCDDYMILTMIDPNGKYDGQEYRHIKSFDKMIKSSKYLDFMNKIIDDDIKRATFKNKNEVIADAFKKIKCWQFIALGGKTLEI